VTVLEMAPMLARTAPPIHSYILLREYWEELETFTGVTDALVTGIFPDYVAYTDKNGVERKVKADTVLFSVGMKPKHAEAAGFAESGGRFCIAGDCDEPADIQRAVRGGYGAAVSL
jgi:pyruvate/2-oxoglutarate dehydrogenase complex dihydrolipoamide dehydrogenase (E3) component